ncbi:nitroreductase [Clostridium sp. 19966]|uniref:nitroreductase family protein n=1 Tax=Clostridium sp. 19966 TaxID=2768166 RepID=UPI0028DF18A2|nr:nitroreductase [Clostridium sp. 19966]MDT8718921.1 nitroreductase [Clostridium sp. 19966]
MNETLKTILNRRSTRKYKAENINDEELNLILEAAKFAPTGMNRQPWHFTAVQNKELLEKINEGAKEAIGKADNKAFSVFYNAPTLIIASGDLAVPTSKEDCVLALENMFLAAESLNIGSCWIYSIQVFLNSPKGESVRKELGIPSGFSVFGTGAFGYKAAEASPAPRKENTVTIIK